MTADPAPDRPLPERPPPAGGPGDETPDPLRVLLVEDDPDHAALVGAYLEDVRRPAVAVDHAGTVAAAAAALSAARDAGAPYHVVLADQQLPDSTHTETVPRLVDAAGGAPVVALTSLGDAGHALGAARAGASDYLVKSELAPELLHRTLLHAVERARRDAALRETNEALRDALQRVRQMQAQLVEQEKLAGLGRLLAGVAHELRNPLGLAVNSAEAVANEAEALAAALGPSPPPAVAEHLGALREYAAGVVRSGRRADGVVRAMYDHARGVDGPLRPVDLAGVVRAALAQAPTEGVEVETDIEDGVGVVGVGSALVRMLGNLLDNAVRAAQDGGGHVRVSAASGPAGAALEVEDDGPGFGPAALDQALEPFYSGWPSGRRVGLGLTLARAVAVGHGGRVELGRSGRLGGGRVRVTLPAGSPPAEPDAAADG